jgi:long-chain fatty acid transport protein
MRKLILAATTLLPATSLAGGYAIPNENARDLALGQAAVAAQTDPGAILLNPAALAGPLGLGVTASGELLVNQTTWTDMSLGSASLVPQANLPPAIAVSYGDTLPNEMNWGAGVGFGVPGGGSIVWPNGWPGSQYIQSVKQQVFAIAGGAAIQPLPYLKVGVTYVRYQVTEELHQEINYLDHLGDAGLAMSGGANSFGIGVEANVPNVPLSFGINYHHSADLTLTGNAHFQDVPAAFSNQLHDQGVHEALTIPNTLDIGAAYDVMPDLKVMFTYSFERWSVYKDDTFVGNDTFGMDADGNAEHFTVTVPRDYTNAHIFRLGGEWQKTPFLPALTLRAGVIRSLSDQPTDTLSPSLTDGNSWAFSVGAGYNVLPQLRVDVAYQHAFFDAKTASGTETFPGTYDTNVDLVSIGASWRTDLGLH